MTTTDLDLAITAKIRANAEPVIVDTQEGWRTGVRGCDLFTMGCMIGRLTITEDDQVFHSMLGSRPTFNREEAYSRVSDLEAEAREIQQTIDRL